MKKIGLIVVLFTMLATSCSKWLDVNPKTEIKAETMFDTEVGFKDALIGIYLVMSESAMYGRELTVGMIDVLGQQYNLNKDSRRANYYFSIYDYKNAEAAGIINSAWNRAYYAIANINNLLYYLDAKKENLHPTHYAIIKGEALGLRAFIHFDLLKMFSKGNLAKTPSQLEDLSIPYVYDYDKSITKQSKVKEVLENIHKDLIQAEELLTDFDPWGLGSQGDDYVLPNDDKFYTNRAKRFNYWAVVATQARVYMWEGKIDEALQCAESFIDNRETRTSIRWISKDVIDAEDLNERDYTFSSEHIFQLNATKQFDLFKDLIDPSFSKPNPNINLLSHTAERAMATFQINEGVGKSDYRWTRLYNTSDYSFLKLFDKDEYKFRNIMPMIRMSEIYYIAAECKNIKGDAKSAVKYLNEVRRNRGIANSFMLEESLSQENVTKEVEYEYLKEFICEGQLFYFYKRLGYSSIPYSTAKPIYAIPLPEDEVNIGGREDINKKQ